jgi:hypothetical protein
MDGIEGTTMRVVGYAESDVQSATLPVVGDSVGTFRVYVTAAPSQLEGKATELEFVLTNQATNDTVRHETLFAGPAR